MNVLVIYEDPQDAVQRGRLIAEVISSNLCKKGLNVTLVGKYQLFIDILFVFFFLISNINIISDILF